MSHEIEGLRIDISIPGEQSIQTEFQGKKQQFEGWAVIPLDIGGEGRVALTQVFKVNDADVPLNHTIPRQAIIIEEKDACYKK